MYENRWFAFRKQFLSTTRIEILVQTLNTSNLFSYNVYINCIHKTNKIIVLNKIRNGYRF